MRISIIGDVKCPSRGTEKSAGIDFYVPNNFKPQILKPGQSVLIPSGIRTDVPEGYALIAFNKSGRCIKGLSVGAEVVDEDYQGQLHLHLYNHSDGDIEILPSEKIVQFILLPIFYDSVEVVDDSELFSTESERGSGGFGSTGLK